MTEQTYAISFTADQWRQIYDAVSARADSLPDARYIKSDIEIAASETGFLLWGE